ncbi:MAG: hypothetical protein LBJ33_23790 [Pseudomonas putida]|jgi:hypothetical protein|nr:hypothetical protein [Pseudomonas putida]
MTVATTFYLPPHDGSRALLADTPTTRRALAQWRQARQTFNRLLSLAPGVRQVVNDVLRNALASDPDHTGLVLESDNQFIKLTQLCVFAHQHRTPPQDLNTKAKVKGKSDANRQVTQLRPNELYARLVALDLATSTSKRWQAYWDARAEGTTLSRREHARQQYRAHFLATLDIVLDQGTLDVEHRAPVIGLLENPEWLIHNQKKVQLAVPSSQPGALVISLEGEAPQVLYSPEQTQAFMGYATREALETHLASTGHETITYTAVDGIGLGFTSLLNQLGAELLDTLATGVGPDLETDAATSLARADELEQTWRNSPVFAQSPDDDYPHDPEDSHPTLFDFGNLGLDLAPALRKTLIGNQLTLLETRSASEVEACQRHQDALDKARNTAQTLITQVTSSAKWHSDARPVTASTPLIEAHRDGLLAHAQFQHALGLLDAQHLAWVKSVCTEAGTEAVAAQIELQHETSESTDGTMPDILHGALVITVQAALDATGDTHTLLLYWLGEHGGLLRCEGQRQLEACLKAGLPVRLSALSENALGHTLEGVLAACRKEKDTLQERLGLSAMPAQLPQLRESLALRLQVPRHAARETALHLHKLQQDVITQAGSALDSLGKVPPNERLPLRTLVHDYLIALRKAQSLLRRDLPEREQFCRNLINRRLRQDVQGFVDQSIKLDVPVSTSNSGKDLIAGSGAPGTPVKSTLKPSTERVTLALETVLLQHIDDAMHDRLRFVNVKVTPDDDDLRQRLQDHLDASSLRTLANELDIAKQYEATITHAFMGNDEGDYEQAYRRECLIEPHRLILKLQNLLFHISGHLDSTSHAMFAQVIDSHSKADLQANGFDLRLLAARLTSGGKDTSDQPTTLAGITFIEDRIHKTTLLYRPDHPIAPLRQYPDLESARLSLFEGSVDARERDYLVSRALGGNSRAHHSRLNQAHQHRFNGIIGIGAEWPATQSLAQLQLDTHMGQLLQAHRDTSRTNLDLHLENLAAQAGKLLLGFKIALGVIPVLGLPVSLYDLYDASAELVRALADGQTGNVLDAIENVLASLIDIAMDVLGSGVNIRAPALRRSARRYQLAQLSTAGATSPHLPTPKQEPLAGLDAYRVSEPVSLVGLSPANEGRYRGIYRHSQGNYIVVQDHQYKVRWDETSHTWELTGDTGSVFKRAIALDDTGNWDTHLALYGVHRLGGGAGGGQALGRLADTLDPIWPAVIRDQLPRWWRDRAYRLHNRLRESTPRDWNLLEARTSALRQRMKPSLSVHIHNTELIAEIEACIKEAKRLHADLQSLTEVSSGRLRTQSTADANEIALMIVDGHYRLIEISEMRYLEIVGKLDKLMQASHKKTHELIPGVSRVLFLAKLQEYMDIRLEMNTQRGKALAELAELREYLQAIYPWRKNITKTHPRRENISTIDAGLQRLKDSFLDYMEISQLQNLLIKPMHSPDAGWLNLSVLMAAPQVDLDRALHLLHELPNVQASQRQRGVIVARSIDQIGQFKSRLRYWKISYTDYLDLSTLKRLETKLDAYMSYARKLQDAAQPQQPSRPGQGPNQPRVFETVQDHYLIGTRDRQQPNTYRVTGANGRIEIYRQDASGKFTLTNPAPAKLTHLRQATLKELQAEATRHLDALPAFKRQIDQYMAQDMDGASLQNLMQFKATDLDDIASRITPLDPTEPSLARLREASAHLIERGRALRIEQIMKTREPKGVQLDYLVEQDVVKIEKVGSLVELKRTPDGRPDFLQEFQVLDERQELPKVLWYAHVHFNKPTPEFEDFVKAHLKTPAQRYLGKEWQVSHVEVIWRGDLSRAQALKHLAPHF